MKPTRLASCFLVLLTATAAFAASDAQPSSAKQSFDRIKSLAGTWEGKTTSGETAEVSFRVTGDGSAVMSEIKGKADMITMFNLDGDRLIMTHYCAVGNQPRMKAVPSADGKTLVFEFVDATNLSSPRAGHMNRAAFDIADADHHTEEWTYTQDGKDETELFTLERKK